MGGSAVKVPLSYIFGYFGSIGFGFAVHLPLISFQLDSDGVERPFESIYQTLLEVFPLIILFELHVPTLKIPPP